MTVIPHRANLLQDRNQLHQFLLNCQQSLTEKDRTKIVSISQEIYPLDPLAVLQEISEPCQRHFYFEKRNPIVGKSFAIAALDSAIHLTVAGTDRFTLAQNFIRSTLANTITIGAERLPFSGPHFFCSFAFFDENIAANSYFPPATIFLPKWQITRQKDSCILVANAIIEKDLNIKNIAENIWQTFDKIESRKYPKLTIALNSSISLKQIPVNDASQFKTSVKSALELIASKYFSKIVLSQAINVIAQTPFSLIDSLNNLRLSYPDCYVFSTSNGKGQTFIGASPERLISIHNNQLLTDALAGSAPRGKTEAGDAKLAQGLLESEKDIREHQVVIDFIVDRLSKLGITPKFSPVPRLLQLSNIQHLWTPITAQIPPDIHLLKILAQLHPTPAVAGVPRDIALEQIRRCESCDRSLYAAPLGWIDRRGNGEFAVGIRSALIDGDRAILYAGAGIVAGSEPEKELAEIQLKLQALLNALV
ncbi:Isochorismate synthase @ Phylloquinone-specific isochorismate synthase [uncultured Microcoleus sp.]|uniref:isochorismate synthase n=1 Tax=uncultured Microcoleus sp. TaxID=259945 RepID=A0A6J4L1H2_9CYAN|nr:Isochorismate synthase @ Phylloquinone-specific isochorismate synthase [uncultured Microcoleus sp.]